MLSYKAFAYQRKLSTKLKGYLLISDKRLIYKIYKGPIQVNIQILNNSKEKWAKVIYSHLSKDTQKANRHMKRSSMSLIIKEI